MPRVPRRCTRPWRVQRYRAIWSRQFEILADMVLHPHLEDDEFEPIRRLCLQNLRSLEDDPGSKVIYELRRRHFPDPWGRPSPGTPEGVSSLTPEDLRGSLRHRIARTVRSSVLRERSTGRACATRSASFSATGRRSRRPKWSSGLRGRIAITSCARRSKSRSCRVPRSDRFEPRVLPSSGHDGDSGRVFVGPAFHRGP